MHEKESPLILTLIKLVEELKDEKVEEPVEQPVERKTNASSKNYNLYKKPKYSIVNPTNANKQYYDTEFTQKTYYTD